MPELLLNADDDEEDEDARILLLVPETVIRSLKAFPIGFEFNAKEEEEHERVLLLLLLLRNNGASLVLVSSILVVFETVDVVGDVRVNIVASIVMYVYILYRARVMRKNEQK